TWRSPEGPGSGIEDRLRHPVVHVTQRDARAYAAWAGGRLPGEVEWEYAASLGLVDPTDPASGVRGPDGTARANVWTGIFPLFDTGADGHAGVAPVGCYEASRVGVHDMIGNVWEWTESRFGPATPRVAIKGGSYLCGANYCRRARAAARESMEPDLGTGHVGFRIVKDVDDRG
ncbi:MAG: SUMF1/EgtB/PvdO family nonheme iron enzyme, partial [Pseudomonadota bacterium]